MATITQNVVHSTINTPAVELDPDEPLNLPRQFAIYALSNFSVGIEAGGNNVITIAGGVFSKTSFGINSLAGDHEITITPTGSVYGEGYGIYLEGGNNTITNGGIIDAIDGYAVRINGTGNTISNAGVIRSAIGSAVFASSGVTNSVTNTGSIETTDLYHAMLLGGTVTNSGTIRAGGGIFLSGATNTVNNNIGGSIVATNATKTAIEGTDGVDKVVNKGAIHAAGTIAIDLFAGSDTYDGRGGQVVGLVRGGDGNDTLFGGGFADEFQGGAKDDYLNGGGGLDTLVGDMGNDAYVIDRTVDGGAYDTITELTNQGTDTVQFKSNAAGQSYTLPANFEHLVLLGTFATNGTGSAQPNGITGNSATNVLNGREGLDTLQGGLGMDYFLFNTPVIAANKDTIVDFSVAEDTIRLDNAVFTTLVGAEGAVLSAGQFRINNANGVALDADDRIIYDQDHGRLWYDSNGSNVGGTIVNFASVTAYLAMTNADFFIV